MEGNKGQERFNSSFFSNTGCEYFPCHEGVEPERFNCLFCYCPLYALGDRCGGNFVYTPKGVKSCVGCKLPHDGEGGARLVREKWPLICALAQREDDGEGR